MDKTPTNPGEFFVHCRRRYGLAPTETLGLLGVADTNDFEDLGGFEEALMRIEKALTLSSGRTLWPAAGHADLAEALDEAEKRAWAGLRNFRFHEFAHWAEVWASVAKISGQPIKNPFGTMASMGSKRNRGGRW